MTLSCQLLYSVQNGENHQIHIESGVGLPTGSIDERADIPAGPNQRLPYPMQLGSGTYDPKLGLTYSHVRNDWYFGANTSGTWRLGRNDNNYRLGNQYVVDGWASYRFNPWLHSSARTVATFLGDIHGADPELNPMMVPTANPNLRGGKWVDILLGVNVFVPDGKLFGNRFFRRMGTACLPVPAWPAAGEGLGLESRLAVRLELLILADMHTRTQLTSIRVGGIPLDKKPRCSRVDVRNCWLGFTAITGSGHAGAAARSSSLVQKDFQL